MEIIWNFAQPDLDGFVASKIMSAEYDLARNIIEVQLGFSYQRVEANRPFSLVSARTIEIMLTTGDLQASLGLILPRASEQGKVPSDAELVLVGV